MIPHCGRITNPKHINQTQLGDHACRHTLFDPGRLTSVAAFGKTLPRLDNGKGCCVFLLALTHLPHYSWLVCILLPLGSQPSFSLGFHAFEASSTEMVPVLCQEPTGHTLGFSFCWRQSQGKVSCGPPSSVSPLLSAVQLTNHFLNLLAEFYFFFK